MAIQFFSGQILLWILSFFFLHSCSSKENKSNTTAQNEFDSCKLAKPFENIIISESLVESDYTGELKNYWRMDTTKLDFKHFFEQGKLIKSIFYFENGRVQEEYFYKCGGLHGLQKYYYENGNLAKKIPFSYGYRQGTGELFDEQGTLRQQVTFIADSLVGEPKNFDENGKLIILKKN